MPEKLRHEKCRLVGLAWIRREVILLMLAKYGVGAQRAAPAPARHSLCPKTTLYFASINKRFTCSELSSFWAIVKRADRCRRHLLEQPPRLWTASPLLVQCCLQPRPLERVRTLRRHAPGQFAATAAARTANPSRRSGSSGRRGQSGGETLTRRCLVDEPRAFER